MDTNESEQTNETAESSTSQEASQISEVTPASDTVTESTEQVKEVSKESGLEPVPENYEYNGDRNSVPKPLQNYVKGIDRYWSKKSQALAELGQKAKEFEDLKSSEDWKSFEQFRKSNKKEPVSTTESLVSQDEIDAIALGDAKTLESVIDRAVSKRLESKVTPIVMKQRELEAADTIKAFTQIHPDFEELLNSPAGEFMLDAAKRGADIETIYSTAIEAQKYFIQQHETKRKADIEAKRNGSVVKNTVTGTPDVVYADTEDEAKRLAIQLTMKGDKRTVAVRNSRRK